MQIIRKVKCSGKLSQISVFLPFLVNVMTLITSVSIFLVSVIHDKYYRYYGSLNPFKLTLRVPKKEINAF